jgi:hypothetical protein
MTIRVIIEDRGCQNIQVLGDSQDRGLVTAYLHLSLMAVVQYLLRSFWPIYLERSLRRYRFGFSRIEESMSKNAYDEHTY